jgi:diguanylate cyclase
MSKPVARPKRPVPPLLALAHRRGQQLGLVRVVCEGAALAAAAVALPCLVLMPFVQSPWVFAAMALAVLLAGALAAGLLVLVLPMVHELSTSRIRIRRLATHDTETGIINRRHFAHLAQREYERCRRYRSGATMIVVEVDHLPMIEEEHGRAASAAVLRSVALACDGALRKSDLLGRHNGELFAAFLPHTETLGAVDVAERLRKMVAETPVPWHRSPLRVTVSIGVAPLGDAHLSLAGLVSETESALQAAQKAGRNCVRVSPQRGSRSSRDYPVMPG